MAYFKSLNSRLTKYAFYFISALRPSYINFSPTELKYAVDTAVLKRWISYFRSPLEAQPFHQHRLSFAQQNSHPFSVSELSDLHPMTTIHPSTAYSFRIAVFLKIIPACWFTIGFASSFTDASEMFVNITHFSPYVLKSLSAVSALHSLSSWQGR